MSILAAYYKRETMLKRIVVLLLPLVLFTSCFEFVEEITFNKDGSGNATLTLNFSKSKTKLKSIMLLDSVNGYKVPSKQTIQTKVAELVSKIKKTKGVSNVKSSLNFDEFIVAVSCDFNNINTLNKVIASFKSKKDKSKSFKYFSYDTASKIFKRSNNFNLSKEFKKVKSKDRKVFQSASYTSICRFETPVQSVSNTKARISKSKKAVMLRLQMEDMVANTVTIKNNIQLFN